MPASSIPGHVWRRQGTSPTVPGKRWARWARTVHSQLVARNWKMGKALRRQMPLFRWPTNSLKLVVRLGEWRDGPKPGGSARRSKKGGPFFLLALGTRFWQTKFWPWAHIQHKYSQLVQPLQDQASSLCGRAFSQLGAQAMLAAVPCLIYEKSTTKWRALGPTTRKFLVDLGEVWVGLGLAFF